MKPFFEGWYFKHQFQDKTLAVISGRADGGAFVQIITDECSHNINYPLSAYNKTRERLLVGGNIFNSSGIILDIKSGAFSLSGNLRYGTPTRLKSDIMGPFRFFPMECRHSVISMLHSVSGSIAVNGETRDISGGIGYIESDSGRSFPDGYTWVQCNDFPGGESVIASAAKIPFMGSRFWGCIAAIMLNGREYRLATYSGARIVRNEPGKFEIRQGGYRLEINTDAGAGHPLAAPEKGKMLRTIYESTSCKAHFRFFRGKTPLFDAVSKLASYEYVKPECL